MINQAADVLFVSRINVVVVRDPLLLVIGVTFDGERDGETMTMQSVAGMLLWQRQQPPRRLDGIVALYTEHAPAAARG